MAQKIYKITLQTIKKLFKYCCLKGIKSEIVFCPKSIPNTSQGQNREIFVKLASFFVGNFSRTATRRSASESTTKKERWKVFFCKLNLFQSDGIRNFLLGPVYSS